MRPNLSPPHQTKAQGRLLPFREIWVCDFEFVSHAGEHPDPVCMVAAEFHSGRVLRLWRDELRLSSCAPFDVGEGSLFTAFFAPAELGCFFALGWPPPARILDLYAEFRAITNGRRLPHGNGLLGAAAFYGLSSMQAGTKDAMRDLIMSGGPWTSEQRSDILRYCEEDVHATRALLAAMLPDMRPDGDPGQTRLGQALLRGRYMAAVACMEREGVPVDTEIYERLQGNWRLIQSALIDLVDGDYGVYEGQSFKAARFEEWLRQAGLPWPRLPSGVLALDDDTFREMARAYPTVGPLRELRHTLGRLRRLDLSIGEDGRNRCMLSPLRSKTGRNQPSNTRFIFGSSRWLRGLIKPPPGCGLAYLDFSSQEIAIAAALSGDSAMAEAYQSGDPYLAFAKRADMAPPEATKVTHADVRARCKAIVLGVGYGMGAEAMAYRAGIGKAEASELLQRHREAYRVFWNWAENNVNTALAGGVLQSQFGWPLRCAPQTEVNTRSLLNFPMQANGAEMLRLAACEATESGLRICAPIHDALLLEAPLYLLEEHVERLRQIMEAASRMVMQSLACRVDTEVIRYPDRFRDESGGEMWDRVTALLQQLDGQAA